MYNMAVNLKRNRKRVKKQIINLVEAINEITNVIEPKCIGNFNCIYTLI